MKPILLAILLWVTVTPLAAQKSYAGEIDIKENTCEIHNNTLIIDLTVKTYGLVIGTHQNLIVTPTIRNGKKTLALQPIIINGRNKQKMYLRKAALQGIQQADKGAYIVINNNCREANEFTYIQTIPYKEWMNEAEFVLVGKRCNYAGNPVDTYIDVLTANFL